MRKLLITKRQILNYIQSHSDITREKIAAHFNLSLRQVSYILSKYSIRLRSTDILGLPAEEFIQFAKDHTVNEIVEKFRVNKNSVWAVIYKRGIVYKREKENYPFEKQGLYQRILFRQMVKELSSKFTQTEIATVFGYSVSYISEICKDTLQK